MCGRNPEDKAGERWEGLPMLPVSNTINTITTRVMSQFDTLVGLKIRYLTQCLRSCPRHDRETRKEQDCQVRKAGCLSRWV